MERCAEARRFINFATETSNVPHALRENAARWISVHGIERFWNRSRTAREIEDFVEETSIRDLDRVDDLKDMPYPP